MEFLILLLSVSTLMGFANIYLAKRLQRAPLPWFLVGFFFGLLGILTLLLLPRKAKPKQTITPPPSLLPLSPEELILKEKLWYYLDATHQQMGPYNFSGLLKDWMDSKVSVRSYVWQEGMENWLKIVDFPRLRTLLEREEITS